MFSNDVFNMKYQLAVKNHYVQPENTGRSVPHGPVTQLLSDHDECMQSGKGNASLESLH